MTKYERAIYQMVNTSCGAHMTAEQVYDRLQALYPAVSRATVYNNLNKLCQAGLIRKLSVEGATDRYDRMVKHDHLVCQKCGKLADVSLEDLTASLREQVGGAFVCYDLKVYYLCPDCRGAEAENGRENPGHRGPPR